MNDIGLCVIGGGAIAERHLLALERLGGIRPRWVVSDRLDAARDFAARWKFAHAGLSTDEALSDPAVDLVLIASPSPLHSEQAIQALQAGKDAIVEIPIAMSWPEAQRVSQTAATAKRRAWVCHTMRSRSALRLVRDRIESGALHVTQITGFLGTPRRRNQGMDNVGTRTWIDNLLWHHACHQVDISLWALGMPEVKHVQALWGPTHAQFGMALDVGVHMSLAGGTLVTHALSYNVDKPGWRLQFIGNEDLLTFNNGRLTNEAGEELASDPASTDCTVQNREILESWRSGGECEFDLARVLPTMQVLGRAQESADDCRPT